MYVKQKYYKKNTPVLHFLLHPGCKEGVITSVFSCKDSTPHYRKSGGPSLNRNYQEISMEFPGHYIQDVLYM